jgi:hypothetical protein
VQLQRFLLVLALHSIPVSILLENLSSRIFPPGENSSFSLAALFPGFPLHEGKGFMEILHYLPQKVQEYFAIVGIWKKKFSRVK